MSTVKSSSANLTLNADGSNNDIIFQSNGSTKVTLDGQNGRVGIGTSSPLSGLHLENTSSNDGIRIINSTSGEGYIVFGDDADNNTGSIAYDHASDAMTFDVNNSERLRILSGGGLTFNGDTAAANALDDYEEGTWTPILSDGTNDAVSYTDNVGRYVKIGSMVTIYFAVQASNMGSISGTTYIMDLPFTVTQCSNPYPQGVLDVYATASNLTGYQCLQISGAGDRLTMIYNAGLTSGHIAITDAYLDTGTTMRGQIQYFTH